MASWSAGLIVGGEMGLPSARDRKHYKTKLILFIIILLLGTAYFLYFGVTGVIAFSKLFVIRCDIAASGIVTNGEIISTRNMNSARSSLRLVSYKFYVEGYENSLFDFLKDRGIQTDDVSNDKLFSWAYGEDVESSFGTSIYKGKTVKVTYDPDNPKRNLGGDRRGDSFWELTKGYRSIMIQTGLAIIFGIFFALLFSVHIYILIKSE